MKARHRVISYRVSAAGLRLLKTVAKYMYGELDLIDARPQISHMIRFSINYRLYYSICAPGGHLREKEAGAAQGPAGVYELEKP